MRADSDHTYLWIYTDGSFTPASGGRPAFAGWAAVCIDPFRQQVSLASGPVLADPEWGDEALTPYLAECFALTAAGLIATAAFSHRPVIFLSDCTAAVGAASGTCAHQLQGTPHLMSSMHVFRNQVCAQADQYRHIPGHCGIPGNELADVLSKQGARSRAFTCGLLVSGDTLSRWFSADSRLLSWAALAVRSLRGDPTVPPVNTDLSALHSHHAGLAPSQLLAPFLPPGTLEKEQHEVNQSAHAPYQTRVIPYRLGLNLATFNVLSSEDRVDQATGEVGLAYQPARAALSLGGAAQITEYPGCVSPRDACRLWSVSRW